MYSTKAEILEELSAIVGAGNVDSKIVSPEGCLYVYLYGHEHHMPTIVVRPKSAIEVSRVVRFANNNRIQLVPWGGGTNRYSGGFVAPERAIVLCTQRLNKIISRDFTRSVVTVQAGLTVAEINRELSRNGLWWPHDPESKIHATIGGCISVNGIGTYATRFGTAAEMVRALKIVLPSGEIASLGSKVRHSLVSRSLVDLLGCSEGTLALVVEATLKVEEMPKKIKHALVVFDNISGAVAASLRIFGSGLNPDALIIEDTDRFCNAVADIDPSKLETAQNLMSSDSAALAMAFSGSSRVVDFSLSEAIRQCSREGGELIKNSSLGKTWWKSKTESLTGVPLTMGQNPAVKVGLADVAVPIMAVPLVQREFTNSMTVFGLSPRGVRCYLRSDGDALMRLAVSFDASHAEQEFNYKDWVCRISELAFKAGGTMSSSVGCGLRLARCVGDELGDAGPILSLIKRSIDQNNIMNPGKKLPSS